MSNVWGVFKTTHGWSEVEHLAVMPHSASVYVAKACNPGTLVGFNKFISSNGFKRCELCEKVLVERVRERIANTEKT